MESDFTIRNHLDSVNLSNDPSVFELLNRYKESPEPSVQPSTLGDSGLETRKDTPELKKDTDGLSLSVGPDVVKWVVLLVVVLLLVWLFAKKDKKSKLAKRMKSIEKELIRLRRNPEE